MIINELSLKNFKNYKNEKFELHPGINVIIGENAQGKTNFLESIFYLSTLRPARGGKEKSLISFNEDYMSVSAAFEDNRRKNDISVELHSDSSRKLYINKVLYKKKNEFIGTFQSIYFAPDDLSIAKEGSAGRRKIIDIAMCQLRPRYCAVLTEYNRLTEQKGSILKASDEKPSLLNLISTYNKRISILGGQLISFRHAYCKLLKNYAASVHRVLSGGKEELSLRYISVSNIDNTGASPEELSEKLLQQLELRRAAEITSKTCLSGPHRDDIEIIINSVPAKTFASQGQIRTAILSIKLAERDIFQKESGEPPVLLLDDVLSELDPERQNYVLNKILNGQVFISCCSFDRNVEILTGRRFSIRQGKIESVKDF